MTEKVFRLSNWVSICVRPNAEFSLICTPLKNVKGLTEIGVIKKKKKPVDDGLKFECHCHWFQVCEKKLKSHCWQTETSGSETSPFIATTSVSLLSRNIGHYQAKNNTLCNLGVESYLITHSPELHLIHSYYNKQ